MQIGAKKEALGTVFTYPLLPFFKKMALLKPIVVLKPC